MRLKMYRNALLALALSALVTSSAIAEGWFSDADAPKDATLGELLRTPKSFVGVELKVKLYFQSTGTTYNPYYTRFHEDLYGNVSAWPINARLYDRRDFQSAYPYFFMNRESPIWEDFQDVKRFQAIEVSCVVHEVFRGQPWIEIKSYTTISEGLRESDVRNVIAGDAYSVAGRHKEARRSFEKVSASRLPKAVRADVLRKRGDAQFRDGDFRDAIRSYEYALEIEPKSTVLEANLDAAKRARERARRERRGDAVLGDQPVLVSGAEPVTAPQTNDVNEIIKLLDDPKDVEAAEAKWRLELEKRGVDVGTGATAVAVAGEAEKTEGCAAEGCAAEGCAAEGCAEVVEEEKTEGCSAEASADGCGESTEGCGDAAEGCGAKTDGCGEKTDGGDEATEGCADVVETTEEGCAETEEETVEGCGTETDGCDSEGCAGEDTVEEGCAESTDGCEGCGCADDESAEGCETEGCADEGCGEGCGEESDGDVATTDDPDVSETTESEEGCGCAEEACGCATDGCGCAACGCGDDASDEDTTEGCGCAEEQGCTAGDDESEVDEGCAEEVVDETPEGCGCASGEGTAEGCADGADDSADEDDNVVEESDEGCTEGCTDEDSDGCACGNDEDVVIEEGTANEDGVKTTTVDGDAGEAPVEGAAGEGAEESVKPVLPTVTKTDDPRVVNVAGKNFRLPRLPFFGCDRVTTDDWVSVLEEIIRNPENAPTEDSANAKG